MEMDQVKASVGGLRKPDCKPKCLVAVFGCVLAYQNGVVHRARSAQPFEIIEDRSTASVNGNLKLTPFGARSAR